MVIFLIILKYALYAASVYSVVFSKIISPLSSNSDTLYYLIIRLNCLLEMGKNIGRLM